MSGILSVSLNDNLNIRLEGMINKLDERIKETEPLIKKYEHLANELSLIVSQMKDSKAALAIWCITICSIFQTIIALGIFLFIYVNIS